MERKPRCLADVAAGVDVLVCLFEVLVRVVVGTTVALVVGGLLLGWMVLLGLAWSSFTS